MCVRGRVASSVQLGVRSTNQDIEKANQQKPCTKTAGILILNSENYSVFCIEIQKAPNRFDNSSL
jgi:hypothetical protein